jgi:hypothetical protein
MADILDDVYEQVDNNPANIKYDFVSQGKKAVPKRVSIIQYENPALKRFFNLGFGNITID